MKKIIYFVLVLVFFLYSEVSVFSQIPQKVKPEDSSWRLFEKATLAFDQKQYGDAFRLNNIARDNRKKEAQWSLFVLDQALKPTVIQKLGDVITDILPALYEREAIDAISVIESALSIHDIDYFLNSIQQLRNYIQSTAYFPETDYLSGKIYQLEGEFSLAEEFYLKAWENSQYLDIPDERYDILYSLASLKKQINDSDGYEKALLQIINDSEAEQIEHKEKLNNSMKQSINSGITVDKFFLLYRSDTFISIDACIQLADYYLEKNQNEEAYTMAMNASLAAFTRVYQIITERDQDYVYKEFSTFLLKIVQFPDIVSWCSQKNIWKGFYLFADMSPNSSDSTFSQQLFNLLATNCPDLYWQVLSSKKVL